MTYEEISPSQTLAPGIGATVDVNTAGFDWVAVLANNDGVATANVQILTDDGSTWSVFFGGVVNQAAAFCFGGSGSALAFASTLTVQLGAVPFVPNRIRFILTATPLVTWRYVVIGGYFE